MQRRTWFNIENKASDNPTVYIYGAISAYEVSAMDFINELNGITAKSITLRMHSPGGNVFDGISICSALTEHPATINGQVDGLCGSICSVIAMSCDNLTMAKGSMMMIHNASGACFGNSAEMKKTADILDLIDAEIVKAYASKTGIKDQEIKCMMDVETWMNAEKCLELGFCDKVGNQQAVKNAVDLSGFKNAPEEAKAYFNEKEPTPQNERDLEKILRDSGLSKKDAMTAISAMKAEALRDSEVEEAEKMKKYLQSALLINLLAT